MTITGYSVFSVIPVHVCTIFKLWTVVLMVHLWYHLVAEGHNPASFWCCSSPNPLVYLPLVDRRAPSRLGVGWWWRVSDGSAETVCPLNFVLLGIEHVKKHACLRIPMPELYSCAGE